MIASQSNQKGNKKLAKHDPRVISQHFEKLVSVKSEQQLLATMLAYEEDFRSAIKKLQPEDFGDPYCRQFFACLKYVFDETGAHPDPRTFAAAMVALGPWGSEEEARTWTVELARGAVQWPMRSYLGHNINQIRSAARKRRALERINLAATTLANDDLSEAEVESARDALTEALRANEIPTEPLGDEALLFLESIGTTHGVSQPNPTGFDKLDTMLGGGFRSGQLVVVAGRTGGGKTSFALQVARQQAEARKSALIVSLEMPKAECIARVLSQMSGVPATSIVGKQFDLLQKQQIVESQSRLAGMSLAVDDCPKRTTAEIEAMAADYKRRNGLDVIVVDYIQLIASENSSRHSTRAEQIGKITRDLKVMARTLDCCVIGLSQLKRSDNDEAKPKLSDLRESGSIEQDADVVLFVHGCNRGRNDKHTAMIMIAKQRSGPQSEVCLDWFGPTTSFTNSGEPDAF